MSVDVEQRIRDRAYSIWLEEGCPHGRDGDHWLLAERAIKAETVASPEISPVVAVVKAPRKTTNAKPRTAAVRGAAKVPATKATSAEPPAESAADAPKPRKPRARKTMVV
ncbi:DUF2934 domain-containing protein [Azospirillum sp. B510]|uniref:DUF2934 domain-containing protein n=1 Tax=Azospirillum sp. (strain B510) TaxID=137722 RepID=UPI0005A5D91E|nr:DUF2934 domain-containing protein [Azospirillum sp. B510]